jgi:hypothetical protein
MRSSGEHGVARHSAANEIRKVHLSDTNDMMQSQNGQSKKFLMTGLLFCSITFMTLFF